MGLGLGLELGLGFLDFNLLDKQITIQPIKTTLDPTLTPVLRPLPYILRHATPSGGSRLYKLGKLNLARIIFGRANEQCEFSTS